MYWPPYERTVWFYKKANPELIRRAINEFDWIRALSNVSIDKKVCYFTETLLNITLLNNNSVLPNNLAKLTNKSLDTVNFTTDDISKIINNLDPNKAHGHDMLSIRMIKLCGNSISKPLSITFNDCLKEGKFPSDWKKAHVVPVHKKGDKQCLKNYRPISLLPICSKIFYNELFTFFTDSNLNSPNQSGFRPGDLMTDLKWKEFS